MSAARRKWEQDLIATAALMGAIFEEIPAYHTARGRDGSHHSRRRIVWSVNLYENPDTKSHFASPVQAAYWYIVERHCMSFQNDGTLMPCRKHGGMMNSDSLIRRHQSMTKEAAWRREQKLSSKFRRNFGRGLTVKAPNPIDT